jgi:hypothetical protein
MAVEQISPFVRDGARRLVNKGHSLRFVANLYGIGVMSVQRACQQQEKPRGRCPGCGGKQTDPCRVCMGRARDLGLRLLGRGQPLDAVELRIAAEFPTLQAAQVRDVMKSLLLFPLAS